MQIYPITNQPKFQGKLVGKGVMLLKDSHWDLPAGMDKKTCVEMPDNLLNKIREMIKEKPYDVFVSPNKSNPEFLNIDAETSFENVKKGMQGRVKVRRDVFEAFPKAIQDAMELFEEHLAELKAKKSLSKESA